LKKQKTSKIQRDLEQLSTLSADVSEKDGTINMR